MSDNDLACYRIHITGIVQGVGFRPFVYNLATRLGLWGWVLNSSSGVEIEAAGPVAVLNDFVRRLRD
ncbi:MAG: acylphosphatase, partial [Anaerolineae bacterium]|nr:acylphosphatase [Anaerolineae bacterium]